MMSWPRGCRGDALPVQGVSAACRDLEVTGTQDVHHLDKFRDWYMGRSSNFEALIAKSWASYLVNSIETSTSEASPDMYTPDPTPRLSSPRLWRRSRKPSS